ncbi:hypothetical protein [Actinoplanes sp. NPDC051494]|uniref:hypothetical protein n=1 Tax=Actinoplanes sp. NPDC051494 TaxID=3363907 RepID=UPI003795D9CE
MQSIGDPDDDTGDFAEEHELTEVTRKETGEGEPESPDRRTVPARNPVTGTTSDTDANEDEVIAGAGSSTDQHVSGAAESGTFTTDEAPTADTPANGSSNAGINATGANRQDDTQQPG